MCGFGTTTGVGVLGVAGTVGVVGALPPDAGSLCGWVGAEVTEATAAWSVIAVVVVSAEPQPTASVRLRTAPTIEPGRGAIERMRPKIPALKNHSRSKGLPEV